MFAGPNEIIISADRASKFSWDGTTLSIILNGTTVATWTVSGGFSLANGGQIGDSAADLVGFWGATPVAQPAATAQSAVGTTAITTLATTPTATDIAIAVNSLISRVAAAVTLVNQLRSDAVTVGTIKGSN